MDESKGRVQRGRGIGCALLVVLIVAVPIALAMIALPGIDATHHINWYRVDSPTHLTVEVTTGPSGWWRVTDIRETSTTVTITVRSLELNLGPQAGVGYPRELAVPLSQPLGDRSVRDGLGAAVLRKV